MTTIPDELIEKFAEGCRNSANKWPARPLWRDLPENNYKAHYREKARSLIVSLRNAGVKVEVSRG